MKRSTTVLLLMLAWSTAGGCAKYEYDLIEPGDLAVRVGRKQPVTMTLDPLQYGMKSSSGHLVIVISNPTEDPITLLGAQSYAVSADGRSHPLPSMTMAPGSYVKLAIPPARPSLDSSGPTFAFGVGAGTAPGVGAGVGYYDAAPSQYVYDDGGNVYWDWTGQTDVRLLLKYLRGSQTFEHAFVLGRRKV